MDEGTQFDRRFEALDSNHDVQLEIKVITDFLRAHHKPKHSSIK